MGIWIRSQSKTRLINAIEAWFVDEEIRAASCSASYSVIGKYDSYAEALKVLDMIQEHVRNVELDKLSCAYLTGCHDSAQLPYPMTVIFEMPPAGFNTQKEGE